MSAEAPPYTLLIIEDEIEITRAVGAALREQHPAIVEEAGGKAGLEAIKRSNPDIIILDLGLPDLDGLEVCQRIRALTDAPIVVLTARHGEADTVALLNAGADDYITKPFKLAELNARIRARLRPNHTLYDKRVRIDRAAHRAWHGPTELDLSVKEFDLLALLVEEAGRVVPRKEILSRVWTENVGGSGRTLDMHISTLRRKLGDDPNQPTMISTVRSVGFRFERGGG
jgi:DNA-binding response OmpR family regulator